jgi:hypothetical protein
VSNSTTPNNANALVMDQKHIAGADKYYASTASLSLAGTNITPAVLKAVFQADIDATHALDAAEAQAKQLRATQKAARKKANATRLQLKSYIVATAGAAAVQMLEDFGFEPPKPLGKKTVATKAKAIVVADATRQARHTMGKRQRAAIKGTVAPAAAPAPAVAPATPAGPAATPPGTPATTK